ncbi:hypothetical protein [Pseudomarimonas arenosa]|uniref:Uncharacterized protein n=1 Tax=Pseudomarimonas arenosa TaxID=2774145 RepID=A0AAW3ZNK3_9GAMM|nr:hypothetical protein [Pseudomarimonas arenosa]MBD8526752.1 hypothetical protein [Pseudomarimonas arenosa]
MRKWACGIVWLCALQSALAVDLPSALSDWRAWALDQQEFRQCPLQASSQGQGRADYVCAWPGELRLQASAEGARFELQWQLYSDGWITLPGNAEHWPQDVRINGQPAAVVEHRNQPALFLPAGRYQFDGRFEWSRRPQSLAIPDAIALIRLEVDGQPIAPVQREQDELVLGRGASEAPEADAIDLRVFRRLADGLPAQLDTRLDLAVSGEAREIVLGPLLPPGYVAIDLETDVDWPVRLQADGSLRIQAQPDYAEITLRARATEPLVSLSMPNMAAPWPAQEIWSYQPDLTLRSSTARGKLQVDPLQAGVPDEWQNLPSFALGAGDSLEIEQRSRGLDSEQDNRLQLSRQAWLDYNGQGWSFRDQIQGLMLRDWRLDVRPPLQLESATANDEEQYLLITEGADGQTGVEWRAPRVNLSASLRHTQPDRPLPAGGWDIRFDRIDTTLNLPFGYRLLAAPGADSAEGSWLASWNLLELFIVSLITLFAWRLFGLPGAALSLLYLVLSHDEHNAPLWSLGVVLILGLLLRNLPAGRLQGLIRFGRAAVLVLLVLLTLPFAAGQLRLALHPQLEGSWVVREGLPDHGVAFELATDFKQAPMAPPPPPPAPLQAPGSAASRLEPDAAQLDRIEVTGSRIKKSDLWETYSSTSVLQAGRGLPEWQSGQRYRLHWSGPILADQEVRLWLSPPWLTRMLRVIAVLSLAGLLWQLFGRPRPKALINPAAVLLLAGLPWGAAEAQTTPDPALLQELAQRLGRAPDCVPDCSALARADLAIDEDRLRLRLQIHALGHSTLALPSDPLSLSIDRLRLDGRELQAVRRLDEQPSVAVERGVHVLEVEYRISADRIALAFPSKPYRLQLQAEDWLATGISEQRLLTETLRLSRMRKTDGQISSAPAQSFPPYVRVERHLNFALDWVTINTVRRIAPSEGGFSISLPLLPGEKVFGNQFKVRDGRIEIAVSDGEDSVRWDSTLDKQATLSLSAGALADHAETWRVLVSPMWSAEFSGLPESLPEPDQDGDDWHTFRFDPLPGETLNITLHRPTALQGATQAIDRVTQRSQLGRRASDHTLSFTLRATQGGERVLRLPEGAELSNVSRDRQALGLRLEAGELSLPVQPGEQQFEIRYRQTAELGMYQQTPMVALGLPAANISLDLVLPQDRWVWLAFGPANGPAVLIWGELLVLLGLAFALSRLRCTPLRWHHWLLLGLGFALFSWTAFAIVAGWLLAMGWRQRQGQQIESRFAFDAMQIGLAGLGIAALVALIAAIPYGLLGEPNMGISGNGSSAHRLSWFADQTDGALPQGSVVSLPLWAYRSAMLIWALWLANALLGWLRWALQAYSTGGLWRRLRKPKSASQPAEVGNQN